MNRKKTGRPQFSAGPDCVGMPVLKVTLDGALLVYAWVASDGSLVVLEHTYSLERGHEIKPRSALWLAELMGWIR